MTAFGAVVTINTSELGLGTKKGKKKMAISLFLQSTLIIMTVAVNVFLIDIIFLFFPRLKQINQEYDTATDAEQRMNLALLMTKEEEKFRATITVFKVVFVLHSP